MAYSRTTGQPLEMASDITDDAGGDDEMMDFASVLAQVKKEVDQYQSASDKGKRTMRRKDEKGEPEAATSSAPKDAWLPSPRL